MQDQTQTKVIKLKLTEINISYKNPIHMQICCLESMIDSENNVFYTHDKLWPFIIFNLMKIYVFSGAPYATVRQHMINSIEDFFYKLNDWLDAKYATYGNTQNTFSGFVFDPIIYDYIFYKTNTNKVKGLLHCNLMMQSRILYFSFFVCFFSKQLFVPNTSLYFRNVYLYQMGE